MAKNRYFSEYVSRMSDIRLLSSPQLDGIRNADEYSVRLRENFKKIGELATENRKTLDDYIFPLTESNEVLSDAMVDEISEFNENLVSHMLVENLDSAIMSLLSDRLMRDAEEKGDTTYLISRLKEQVVVCHTFMYMTSRIKTNSAISDDFRARGLATAKRVMDYLEPDKFASLSDEAKDDVLMIARFSTTLWGSASGITKEMAKNWMAALQDALAIYDDPFYHEAYPACNWDYYLFRTYEYFSSILDYLFDTKLDKEDYETILAYVEKQAALFDTDPAKFAEYSSYEMVSVSLYQARHLCGKLPTDEYRKTLRSLYETGSREAYDFDSLFVNLRCPADYILTLNPADMAEREKATLERFYRDALDYVFRMPNSGTLGELLELFTPLLLHFIEVPGKISFEEMGLQSLAAFHPPTYVHSRMVAVLSRCMVRHLLASRPELFLSFPGVSEVSDVEKKQDEIIDFTYHAALCHDFGKIPLIDTIFIYGRRLLDIEFEIIKQHPELGAYLLSRFESTGKYADVARGHHKWYDNSRGYPEHFDTNDSPYKTIIDIVCCADCLDAATDTIGRSYNRGKTIDDFEQELIEGSGTRYAPFLAELLQNEDVKKDLTYLLREGRRTNYRDTYFLLRDVQQMAEERSDLGRIVENVIPEFASVLEDIRKLSAYRLQDSDSSGYDETQGDANNDAALRYAESMRRTTQMLKLLGERSEALLNDIFFPLIRKPETLTKEEAAVLQTLCEALLEPASGEELDLFLLFETSTRLLSELPKIKADDMFAVQLNIHISVCYALVNRTSRVTVSREINTYFRDEGLSAAEEAKAIFSNKTRFQNLSDEGKTAILRAMRFYSALYDTFFAAPDTNEKRYQALLNAIFMSEDTFYTDSLPDFPWFLTRCRAIEHMGQLTERGNRWGFTKEQCEEICVWLEELTRLWESDTDRTEIRRILPEAHYRLILLRNAYFAGKMETDVYLDRLLSLYETYRTDGYDMYDVQVNLLLPTEYLSVLDKQSISPQTEMVLLSMYRRIIDYILGSANTDAFNYLLEYLNGFLDVFIEIPGVMLFEEMGLSCLAALHPPTYSETYLTAELTRCLAEHLLKKRPEIFVGAFGCADTAAVSAAAPHIVTELYHAALCHDFGKIAVLDSLFSYGRKRYETEEKLVSLHDEMGGRMLMRHHSTMPYAKAAAMHNGRWEKAGRSGNSKNADAADGVAEKEALIEGALLYVAGRVSRASTAEELSLIFSAGYTGAFAEELQELAADPSTKEDVLYLITDGRKNLYRKTYVLLNNVKHRAEL